MELFIDARREGAAGSSAVSATGFPAWGLGVRFQFSARMWCGLSLARPQRGFQFLAQPLDLLLQALAFLLPLLVLLLQPFDLPVGSVEFLQRERLWRFPVQGINFLGTHISQD